MTRVTNRIVLRPISAAAAAATLGGAAPQDVRVGRGYPTEFSAGICAQVGTGSVLGPFYIHRRDDQVVVGEIGGGLVAKRTAEIGYAVIASAWGHGHATDAVRALVALARNEPRIARLTAHTPLDRPASARVLAKAGFTLLGEVSDEHDGTVLRVCRWELTL